MEEELLKLAWFPQVLALFGIFIVRSLVIAGGGLLIFEKCPEAKLHQIVPGFLRNKELWFEAWHASGILALDALWAMVLFQLGWFHFVQEDNAASFILTFAGFFIWTEIYFYYSHRILHHPKLFWIHRRHHQAMLVNPLTSLSFSVLERSILHVGTIFIPALISFWIPISLEAYSYYFLLNFVLNVYGHLNVEFTPVSWVRSCVGKIVNATTYHALHHSRYRGHYGLFTSVLDKLHGTYFSDYETVHENVKSRTG